MDYSLDLDPDIVCRICLQSRDEMVSIYSHELIDDEIRTMPEIIRSCFNIDISRKESLLYKICELCKLTILSFAHFKEKFLRSEMFLQDIYFINAIENNEANLVDNDIDVYTQIEDTKNDELSIRLKNEEEYYIENLEEFDKEIEIIESNEKLNNSHGLCDLNQLEAPTQKHNGDELHNEQFIKSEIIEHFYLQNEQQCLFKSSEERTDDDQDCEDNVIEFLGNDATANKCGHWYKCKICDKRTRTAKTEHDKLHQSLNMLSDKTDILICNNCPKAYIRSSDLIKHKENCYISFTKDSNDEYTDVQFLDDDTNQIFVCGICELSYENSRDLKCHMMIHLSHYECPFYECGYQYENFHYFCIHVRRKHLNGTTQVCQYCKQENIKDYDELKKHYLVCSARKVKCSECEKTFCSSKSLQSHFRLRHMGRKFVCEICGKSFAQASELKLHNRIHTGERPFSCTICGKNFKTASVRSAHMETHSQAKFKCTLCNKLLGSKRCYQTHIKRHTQEKKYKCSFCGKKFFTNWHLNLHHSKIHKNIEFKRC